jgi:hypothetical protein
MTWVSPLPGTEAVLPEVLEADLVVPTPFHEHDKNVDSGLVVVCVLVYIFIGILMVAFIVNYCKEKKKELGVAPGRGKYTVE